MHLSIEIARLLPVAQLCSICGFPTPLNCGFTTGGRGSEWQQVAAAELGESDAAVYTLRRKVGIFASARASVP